MGDNNGIGWFFLAPKKFRKIEVTVMQFVI